jgi:hypothetical protein
MRYLLGVGILGLLAGCATVDHIRVVQSPVIMTVKHLDIEDGDTVLCDPSGCRVLK